MTSQDRVYTAADLLALPRDDKRYELIKGALVELPLLGEWHGALSAKIGQLIGVFAEQNDLGAVYGSGTGFQLTTNPDTVFGVHVAFVAKDRVAIVDDYFPGAPDLAVEVVSSGNVQAEVHYKVKAYFQAGARLAWVVFPHMKVIYEYLTPGEVRILESDDTLTGGDVLPGFSVKVADIFAVLE